MHRKLCTGDERTPDGWMDGRMLLKICYKSMWFIVLPHGNQRKLIPATKTYDMQEVEEEKDSFTFRGNFYFFQRWRRKGLQYKWSGVTELNGFRIRYRERRLRWVGLNTRLFLILNPINLSSLLNGGDNRNMSPTQRVIVAYCKRTTKKCQ